MSLPVGVRSQLISDSMDLARANLLDYNIPLKLITIIATKDADITFVPYLTAFEKLTFLDNMLYSTSAYELFRVSPIINYINHKSNRYLIPTSLVSCP